MRQKVIAGAAVAVVVGGSAFAAVSATGQGDRQQRIHARHGMHRLHRRDLAAAAYLGITPVQLHEGLRSGRTLAQIAEATPGKSRAGLLDALVSATKKRLDHSVAAGKITQARAARREQRLDQRISALVQRKVALAGKP